MEGYRIRLDGDDIAKIRIAGLHPLWELEDAAHLRAATGSAMARTWMQDSRARLGNRGAAVVRDLRLGAVQYAAYGVSPVEVTGDFGACLEAALRAPVREWQENLAGIGVAGWHLPAPGLRDGLLRLEQSSLAFYDAAIAPYWPMATREVERTTSGWGRVLTSLGVGAMLSQLHHEITWQPPFLDVDPDAPENVCPPGCVHLSQAEATRRLDRTRTRRIEARPHPAGLVILPTVFGQACTIQGKPHAVELVSVPIAVRPRLFHHETAAAHPAESLLGATRAWILQACVEDEHTTSGLARLIGVSVSSVSEHATTLRRSGLLTSHRDGQAVVHRATALGRQLMTAEVDDDDLPARRYFASRRLPVSPMDLCAPGTDARSSETSAVGTHS